MIADGSIDQQHKRANTDRRDAAEHRAVQQHFAWQTNELEQRPGQQAVLKHTVIPMRTLATGSRAKCMPIGVSLLTNTKR
jgi:hypothetical protein